MMTSLSKFFLLYIFLFVALVSWLTPQSVLYASQVGTAGFNFIKEQPLIVAPALIKVLVITGLILLVIHHLSKKPSLFSDLISLILLTYVALNIFGFIYRDYHLIGASRFSGYSEVLTTSSTEAVSVYNHIGNYNQILDSREVKFADKTISLKANHLTTHPPGLYIIANYLYFNYYPNASIRSIGGEEAERFYFITRFLIFAATTTVGLTYLAVRSLSKKPPTALICASLTLGLIALFGYIPYFDLLNMALTILSFWLLLIGEKHWNYLLAGLVFALNGAISFGVIPVGILLPFIIRYERKKPWSEIWPLLITYFMPFIAMIFIYSTYGFSYLAGFKIASLNLARDYNVMFKSYTKSVSHNFTELASHFNLLNTSLLALATGYGSYLMVKQHSRKPAYLLVLLSLLILEVVSGQTRGEMARTVMFFYPLLIIGFYFIIDKLVELVPWQVVFASIFTAEIFITLAFFSHNALSHIFLS